MLKGVTVVPSILRMVPLSPPTRAYVPLGFQAEEYRYAVVPDAICVIAPVLSWYRSNPPEDPTSSACVPDGFQLIDRIELMKGSDSRVRVPLYLNNGPPDPLISA